MPLTFALHEPSCGIMLQSSQRICLLLHYATRTGITPHHNRLAHVPSSHSAGLCELTLRNAQMHCPSPRQASTLSFHSAYASLLYETHICIAPHHNRLTHHPHILCPGINSITLQRTPGETFPGAIPAAIIFHIWEKEQCFNYNSENCRQMRKNITRKWSDAQRKIYPKCLYTTPYGIWRQ